MKKIALLFIFLIAGYCAAAQGFHYEIHRIHFSDVILNHGYTGINTEYLEQSQFQSLAPQSVLLKQNYNFNWGTYPARHGGEFYSISSGIHFGSRKRIVSKNIFCLRIGAKYQLATNHQLIQEGKTIRNYGSMPSNLPGINFSLDSVYVETLKSIYSYDQLMFESGFYFTTSLNQPVAFFTGLGFSVGTSFNESAIIEHEIEVSSRIHSRYIPGYEDVYINDPGRNLYEHEQFSSSKTLSVGIYIPIGIEVGFAGRKRLLNHFRIHLELQGGCGWNQIGSTGLKKGFWFSNLAGIKFRM